MEMELACQVCLGQYDSKGHRPLLLPACGHTFCAFCMELLRQQGKRFCPKCRKEEAVQPVSTLPVNYSLLEIVQNGSPGAAAAAAVTATTQCEAESLSPRTSRPDPSGLTSVRPKLTRMKQRNSSYAHQRMAAAHQPTPPRPDMYSPMLGRLLQQDIREGMTLSASAREAPLPTPATRRARDAHTSSLADAEIVRELQDELDFRMAVHLTFCKDKSHDLDRHTHCPSWHQQNCDGDDLKTILSHIQQI